ncbi:MAG: IS200/IS605 family element transposase accessory protein TnpB [Clostridia bacterium]|nr:IS200/IS605 family element transposase accessory protein TnpB [Clostridia bacterium]
MMARRVEKHKIRKSDPHFDLFKHFCHLSKNLYNHGLYLMRQEYRNTGKVLKYTQLNKILKTDTVYPDYKNMPTAQCAQQTLRVLVSNFKAYQAALRSYHKNPDKFTGKPKLPGYLRKDGYFNLYLTNQNCRFKNNIIQFPKVFDGFEMVPFFIQNKNFRTFQQINIKYDQGCIIIHIVYTTNTPNAKPSNGHVVGINIGVNNLACVANNFGADAFCINGKPIKSINQYYNKRQADMKSELMICNHAHKSNRLNRLSNKRSAKIIDYMHKASRRIIDWCVEHDVTKVIIGHNNGWKQNINFGIANSQVEKQVRQNFTSIPFKTFIDMLCYKANDRGIAVEMVEESYTSGTSFIDDEKPDACYYDKSRRVKRGLFKSNNGLLINADLNAAYQIIKKEVPMKWDRGCVLHPVMLTC